MQDMVDFRPMDLTKLTVEDPIAQARKYQRAKQPQHRLKASDGLAALIAVNSGSKLNLDLQYAQLVEKFDSRQIKNNLENQ